MINDQATQKLPKETQQKPNGESHGASASLQNARSTLNLVTILRDKRNLMEIILSRGNMVQAFNKVKQNNGCSGVDNMEVSDLKPYLIENWNRIKAEILNGKYKPLGIKQVEIPKSNGGIRKLGIPAVIDRLIQQAIMQVLQAYVDQSFSDRSYGFRPRRSAHQAIKESQNLIQNGYEYMVDIDIEKYFDRINHDKLMSMLREIIGDQRVLDLIRKYLNVGVEVIVEKEGVAQGSPISPLLANIYLDKLDKELEQRDHKFVRYADDIKIFVKSQKSASRVMTSVGKFINQKLKLKINESKSSIGTQCKFLGYKISKNDLSVTESNIHKFKAKIREKTKIKGGVSIDNIFKELGPIINGWYGYFQLQSNKWLFQNLDGWIRRRVRACYYVKLKNGKTRLKEFLEAGVKYVNAFKCAFSSRGAWFNSKGDVMHRILKNKTLQVMGLKSLSR